MVYIDLWDYRQENCDVYPTICHIRYQMMGKSIIVCLKIGYCAHILEHFINLFAISKGMKPLCTVK